MGAAFCVSVPCLQNRYKTDVVWKLSNYRSKGGNSNQHISWLH